MCFDARVCAAASRGSNDAVRRLVLAGAELNSRTTDERQWTAYHFAVFGNFPETVKMLHGESVRARESECRVVVFNEPVCRTGRRCQCKGCS